MDKQQMTPQQAIGFLASVIKSGEPFTEQCEQAVSIAMAALSHAVDDTPFAYCFTDVNGRPSELTGPPEHAAPEDKRVITALFKRPAPQLAAAWLEPANELDDDSRPHCVTNERKQELLSKGGMIAASAENYSVPLYTHPAPQVAVPEGFTVVPVREFYVMSEDEDIIGGIGNDLEAGKHLLKLAQEGEPEKAWGLVADIDQTKLAAAPTAPAGEQDPLPVGLSLRPLTDLIHEMDELCRITPVDFEAAVDMGYVDGAQDLHDKIIAECRRLAGMKRQQPVSDPYKLPDRVLMPRALTAENGAKTALSGEFDFSVTMTCPKCHPDDPNPDCEVCAGSVEYEQPHSVPWATIKRIYSAAVDLLATPAPDEREIAAQYEMVAVVNTKGPGPMGVTFFDNTEQGTLLAHGEKLYRLCAEKQVCDGNHGGPRCADPECWIDE